VIFACSGFCCVACVWFWSELCFAEACIVVLGDSAVLVFVEVFVGLCLGKSLGSKVYCCIFVWLFLGGLANFFVILSSVANIGMVLLMAAAYVCILVDISLHAVCWATGKSSSGLNSGCCLRWLSNMIGRLSSSHCLAMAKCAHVIRIRIFP